MILVDTSIWIDHLRLPDPMMAVLLERTAVVMHPFVIGELALGHLRQRRVILGTLRLFPSAIVARPEEVLELIDIAELAGIGIGYVDAHLLASVKLTRNTLLATRDRRLRSVAERLGLLAHFD